MLRRSRRDHKDSESAPALAGYQEGLDDAAVDDDLTMMTVGKHQRPAGTGPCESNAAKRT